MTAKPNGQSVSRRALLRLLAVGTSPLIVACEDGAQKTTSKDPVNLGELVPPAPDRRGREGSKDRINSGDPPMHVPDPDPRIPFLLDFVGYLAPSHGQLRLEDGKATNFYESMQWTRLRSDVSGFIAPSTAPVDEDVTGFVPPVFENDALAVQVVWRFYDRRPNEVIGLYSCRVDGREIDLLRRVIEGTPWSLLPRPTGGHLTDPFLVFRYGRGDLLIERTFSVNSYEFMEASESVWERLDNVEVKLQPLATLEIHVKIDQAPDDSPRYTFHVTLENRGTQRVVFTDPRIAFGDDRGFVLDSPRFVERELAASLRTRSRIMIEVSPGEEGFNRRYAKYVPLPPLPADASRTVILPGGGKFELEVPWTAAEPGPHWLRARWYDFDGPIEPVEGQLPFMPIPDEGPCLIGKGPYPIRGTVFTDQPFEVRVP